MDERAIRRDWARPDAVTIESLWVSLLGAPPLERLLAWPPDVFALTDRVLELSEAYRFVVAPPLGADTDAGVQTAAAAAVARQWWAWLDGLVLDAPPLLVECWSRVLAGASVTVDELAGGSPWSLCSALLALHAAADEACAGLGTATGAPPGPGRRFRGRARELLAETGSLSRVSPGVIRVLPRCRATTAGMSIHSLARHVCVRGTQVDVDWHRILSRPRGVTIAGAHANVVLLPWPLRIRAVDFHPVDYTLPHMDRAEFGFFQYDPRETLDLELVESVLCAAEDEAGGVDIVVLPEGAVVPSDIVPLESVLAEHGVWLLLAGVREAAPDRGQLGRNWVHIGVRQELVWRHARQHKHHRWCLDARQVSQYRLASSLDPGMRWWEAVDLPRRSLQIIDQGIMTVLPLVCEDLARMEPVADLVRAIAPSLVIALLLDGPQLASRWTSRYASVLADDPGSAVCTLTSYGMVRRCVPAGFEPSRVVALWKDASGGLTEVALDEGDHGVLITTNVTPTGSYTADGRYHAGALNVTLSGAHSLRAVPVPHRRQRPAARGGHLARELPPLDEREVTKATSWAESVAEAALRSGAEVWGVIDDALDRRWRDELGLPRPSRLFEESVAALREQLPDHPSPVTVLEAAERLRDSADPAAIVTGTLLTIALEQRLLTEVRTGRLDPEELSAWHRADAVLGT